MNIYEKLSAIQTELKAPKGQYNKFGQYYYRSCEDILEAVKPLCKKNNAVLAIGDEVVYIEGRHYVKATASLFDCEKPDSQISVTAYAREEESKKGMDGSQITGASSSYARKYALNGLFDIDDTKDADASENGGEAGKKREEGVQKGNPAPLTRKEITELGVTDFKAFSAWVRERYEKPVIRLSEKECDEIRNYLCAQKEKREKKQRAQSGRSVCKDCI